MADMPSGSEPEGTPGDLAPPAAKERTSDFERYALLAALTLVVLCLLVWDRWQDRPPFARGRPPEDRTLRVQIGGDAPARPTPASGTAARDTATDVPPAPAPKRTYVVQDGDNLSSIARNELGSAARAAEIASLNHIDDPTRLRIGTKLVLPAK